jgi:hypothetical protein
MDNLKRQGILIQGFDILDVSDHISKMSKKYQAALLSKVEETVNNRESYLQIRKLILDDFNEFTRKVIESIFGDIENA